MAGPKKHHYVPQMHLRRFSVDGKEKQVVAFDKQTGETRLTAIGDAAVQSAYYTIETEEGPSLAYEAKLAAIEGRVGKIIERIVGQLAFDRGPFEVDTDDRNWLALYVALQHLRVPAQRERWEAMWNFRGSLEADMFASDKDRYRAAISRDHPELGKSAIEKMRQQTLSKLRKGKMRVVSGPGASLPIIGEAMPEVHDAVRRMTWVHARRFEPPYFVTSDNPVTLWPGLNHPAGLGVGFRTPEAELGAPLAKTSMLLAANLPPLEITNHLDEQGVLAMNRRTWVLATRFIYASSEEDLDATRRYLDPGEERKVQKTVAITGGGADFKAYREQAAQRPKARPTRRPRSARRPRTSP